MKFIFRLSHFLIFANCLNTPVIFHLLLSHLGFLSNQNITRILVVLVECHTCDNILFMYITLSPMHVFVQPWLWIHFFGNFMLSRLEQCSFLYATPTKNHRSHITHNIVLLSSLNCTMMWQLMPSHFPAHQTHARCHYCTGFCCHCAGNVTLIAVLALPPSLHWRHVPFALELLLHWLHCPHCAGVVTFVVVAMA
jgi:hypothetical protein